MFKNTSIIFLSVLLQGCGCYQYSKAIQKNTKPRDYFGVMKSKFIDSMDRGAAKVIFENGTEIYMYAYEMYDELQSGDTVIKKAGSLKFILKRDGVTKEYYPKCDGKEIK